MTQPIHPIHPAAYTLAKILDEADETLAKSRATSLSQPIEEARKWIAEQPIEYRLQTYARRRAHSDKLFDELLEEARRRKGEAGAEPSYAELVEDSRRFDRVIRAISLTTGRDYLATLDDLDGWAETAALHAGDYDALELRHVLHAGGLELSAVEREVERITLAEDEREEAIQLSATTDEPQGEVNDLGQVLLSPGADKARLITDEYELEKAYLEACELDGRYVDDHDGFVQEYTQLVRAGVDPIATLRHDRREAELSAARERAEVHTLEAEDRERRQRNRDRATRAQIKKLRGSLDGVED